MSAAERMKALWRATVQVGFVFLTLCVSLALRGSAFAQTQNQSDIPPAVAQELQAVKARIAQMESQLKGLAAFVAAPSTFAVRSTRTAPTEVTISGTVSCGHCQGMQPLHKGYTPFTWGLNSVNQGDDIVLVGKNQVYKLQGNKDELLKFMSAKARVTGQWDGSTLAVETIGALPKANRARIRTTRVEFCELR